jgi:hypothetical protein
LAGHDIKNGHNCPQEQMTNDSCKWTVYLLKVDLMQETVFSILASPYVLFTMWFKDGLNIMPRSVDLPLCRTFWYLF